jgi:hypothetical protein
VSYTVRELVAPGNTAAFVCARRGELIYRIVTPAQQGHPGHNFKFSVPMDDMGDGEFLAQDKAIFFMRWIRKALEGVDYPGNHT